MIQAGDILLGNFGAPEWVFKSLVLVIAMGFPVAMFFAWFFGEHVSAQPGSKGSVASTPAKTFWPVLRMAGVTVMALLLVWLVWDKLRDDTVAHRGVLAASVAVLPFVDMSAGGDQEYFADGLSEEILNLLAGIRELKVSGRTSSFSFKGKDVAIPEIGRQLGVAHVLEGSVRKAGDRVRVTAQLIEAVGGFHLWSETYDRQLIDIFAIQDDIARAIADQLKLSLVDSDGLEVSANSTDSMEAYNLYLEARRLVQGRSLQGLERARELLDRALKLDPAFAPTLAESALVRLMLSDASITPGDVPLASALSSARPLIDQALDIDPRLAEAHAVKGLLHILQRDSSEAETALARALELNPSQSDALNWRAINLRSSGRLRDELTARRHLARIEPLHISNLFNLSIAYVLAGNEVSAGETVQRMRDEFPDSPWVELAELEWLKAFGRLADADRLARRNLEAGNMVVRSAASDVNFVLGRYQESMDLAGIEYDVALLALGRDDEALAAARERAAAAPRNHDAVRGFMYVLSRTGRHEDVLAYYERRWGSMEALEHFFAFDASSAEVIPIATAQYHLDRREALTETIARWRERLVTPLEQGYDMPYFRSIQVSLEALAGNHELAIELLGQAIDAGYRNPQIDVVPSYAPLVESASFQEVEAHNFERINAERAKLDLPPLT